MPRFSKGETTGRPNIDTFGRYLIIFRRFFHGLLLRADSGPGGASFYISVPSLGLPKITARVGSSSSTGAVQRHGIQSLIVYFTYITKQMMLIYMHSTSYIRLVLLVVTYFSDFRN